MEKKINIAIDGHSSTGKSTVAKALAKKLGYKYIDSGAMYRAVTLYAMSNGLIENKIDDQGIIKSLNEIRISFKNIEGKNTTFLNGENVESAIRSMDVSNWVSPVSKIPAIRSFLRKIQQKIAGNGGVVMDGRDIGSVVLPNAELKIFMTASPKIRSQRRYQELIAKGNSGVTLEEVSKNLSLRDKLDMEREENPLVQTEDALLLDNSDLSLEEQLEIALKWAKARIE